MIGRFGDTEARDIANGRTTKAARRVLPSTLHEKATNRIAVLLAARGLSKASFPPGWRLKELHGVERRTYQIRIDGKYRIRFQWEDGRAVNITVGEFHDEDN